MFIYLDLCLHARNCAHSQAARALNDSLAMDSFIQAGIFLLLLKSWAILGESSRFPKILNNNCLVNI